MGNVKPHKNITGMISAYHQAKSMEGNLDLQRDHRAMIQESLAALDPGGVLYFSTNRRKFKLEDAAFDGAEVVEITDKTTPFDFRRPGPHRCWRAEKP